MASTTGQATQVAGSSASSVLEQPDTRSSPAQLLVSMFNVVNL